MLVMESYVRRLRMLGYSNHDICHLCAMYLSRGDLEALDGYIRALEKARA